MLETTDGVKIARISLESDLIKIVATFFLEDIYEYELGGTDIHFGKNLAFVVIIFAKSFD